MKRKRYNDEIKKTIVGLYRSGTSVGDPHREYDVSEVTINNWIKVFSPVDGGDGPTEFIMVTPTFTGKNGSFRSK